MRKMQRRQTRQWCARGGLPCPHFWHTLAPPLCAAHSMKFSAKVATAVDEKVFPGHRSGHLRRMFAIAPLRLAMPAVLAHPRDAALHCTHQVHSRSSASQPTIQRHCRTPKACPTSLQACTWCTIAIPTVQWKINSLWPALRPADACFLGCGAPSFWLAPPGGAPPPLDLITHAIPPPGRKLLSKQRRTFFLTSTTRCCASSPGV